MDRPHPVIKTSVVACIVDDEERVLLMHRMTPPFDGLWIMPGGKIEHGEAIVAALQREVREEVGIEIRVDSLIDVYEHVGVGSEQDHFVILYYRAVPLSRRLRPDGIECREAIWCPAAMLPEMRLAPGARQILGKLFPDLDWPALFPRSIACSVAAPEGCGAEEG